MSDGESAQGWRCYVVAGGLLIILAGLGVRLVHLHVWVPDERRQELIKRRTVVNHVLVQRGTICDRNGRGNVLAIDLDVQDICADPKLIIERDQIEPTARTLGVLLEVDPAKIASRLDRPARRFAYVHRFVDVARAERIRRLKLEGIFFVDSSIRRYPQDQLMCHVLGFANYAGRGGAGVELSMDRYLRGSPGVVVTEVDGLRQHRYLRRTLQVSAQDGAHVELTLDQYIQYFVEEVLDELIEKHTARAACAIVMRVRSGAILAMASRPAYDLNDFSHATPDELLNRGIAMVYEPGSTMKIVPIAAAIEDGVVSTRTLINCEHGSWMHHGRLLGDHGHSYGIMPVEDVLKKSSNVGTAKISLMIGRERLYNYLRSFGLGQRLGVDLPGEEHGILHPLSNWSGISCSRIAIGQGIAVTPLQMLSVYNTIANDGILMKPRVVKRVVADNGDELYVSALQELGRPISPKTASIMRRMLYRVTQDGGTGRRARIDGIKVAGKTGTAQKPEGGAYSSTKYVASFVGFVPAERPEISVIVMVDEPKPRHSGGYVAAPAFKAIAEKAIRYLHFPASGEQIAARF